jgi:hypothetical protein
VGTIRGKGGDERKEDDKWEPYEEEEGDEGKEDDNVEPYEKHITSDIKQGLGYKRARKYPVTRRNDFLWEI